MGKQPKSNLLVDTLGMSSQQMLQNVLDGPAERNTYSKLAAFRRKTQNQSPGLSQHTNCTSTKALACMQGNWVFDETKKTLDSKRFPLLELAEMHAMSDLRSGKYDNTALQILSTLSVFSVSRNMANSRAGKPVGLLKCPKRRHRASHYAHM